MSAQLKIKPDERFGRLTAIRFVENDSHGNARWLFSCDCGVNHIAIAHVVRRGDTKSCGCLRFKPMPTTEKFGLLTPVRLTGHGRKGVQIWLFACDCGGTKVIEASYVRRGRISSCGCAPPTSMARAQKLKSNYAIPKAQALIILGKALCDICCEPETIKNKNGHPRQLSVDHCHITGAVRGSLCSTCNKVLGYYERGWRPGGPIPAFENYLETHGTGADMDRLVKARDEALRRIA